MYKPNITESHSFNGFFTKIVSVMFIFSVFANTVDATTTPPARMEPAPVSHVQNMELGEPYLETNVVSGGTTSIFGKTVPHAEVMAALPGNETFTTLADGKGDFEMQNLPELIDGDNIDIESFLGEKIIGEYMTYRA